MKKLFVFSDENDPYLDELVCAHERINGSSSRTSLHDLSSEYLEEHGIEVVITNGLPRQWYYILKGMNVVSITLGRRDDYYELSDIVIDSKSEDPRRYFVGRDHGICANPDFKFESIANLISRLEWDSNFFGFNVAFLSCMHLTENIYHRIDKFIRKEKIRLVEYLCNCHDSRSVRVAEDHGFRFTDIRITFFKSLVSQYAVSLPAGIRFAKALPEDIPALRRISEDLYSDSRYAFDSNFDPKKINEFYQGWVEKGVLGQYDDECWCLYDSKTPVAFCTIGYLKSNTATIGLVGIHPDYRSLGLGKMLLHSVFNTLLEKGVQTIKVVTQGRNYAAQNLYQSVGFRTKTTQLWYHKWL